MYPKLFPSPELILIADIKYIMHPDLSDDEVGENKEARMTFSMVGSANIVTKNDPLLWDIGDPCDLNNYLPDSGATQHMTPHLADLIDMEEGQNLGIEVANGHVIKFTTTEGSE
jgi:hypothetical protein